jgi:hypothetical protein
MSRMQTVFAPDEQSGSSNVGWAARVNHGNIQQGGTTGWGTVTSMSAPEASGCNTHSSETVLSKRITAYGAEIRLRTSIQWWSQCERLLLRRLQFDGVHVSSCVLALETDPLCMMRWGVA